MSEVISEAREGHGSCGNSRKSGGDHDVLKLIIWYTNPTVAPNAMPSVIIRIPVAQNLSLGVHELANRNIGSHIVQREHIVYRCVPNVARPATIVYSCWSLVGNRCTVHWLLHLPSPPQSVDLRMMNPEYRIYTFQFSIRATRPGWYQGLTIRGMICGHLSSDTIVDHPVRTHLQPHSELVIISCVVNDVVNLDNRVINAMHLGEEVALEAMRFRVLGSEEGERSIFKTMSWTNTIAAQP